MKLLSLFVLALTVSLSAEASPSYKQFYLVNGKQAETEAALQAALKGSEVMECASIEAKVAKSGKSIGLKRIKKPKS